MSDKPSELSTKQTIGIAYAGLGAVLGLTAGAFTFIATWIYCAMTYGFVLGLGLGWFPAAVCAGVVGWLVAIFWGPALLLIGLGGISLAIVLSTNSAFLVYPLMGAAVGWLMWRLVPKSLSGRQ